MPKRKKDIKSNHDHYDKKHLANLVLRAKRVERLFDEVANEAARIGGSAGFKDADVAFYFAAYPKAKKRIDRLIKKLHSDLVEIIKEGDREEWLLSCEKNDKTIDLIVGSTNLPKAQISSWKQPNLSALAAFQSRKIDGLGLSDKVWNITDQFSEELELALDIGLGEGKSAADLSRDVRRFLKEPHKLFRRVRDKHGSLRLSKNAKAYHPGRGVFRSSYKNAIRLTATENNIAYRTSDHERWQQIDFVVGIEIKLSNNHTLNGLPFYDICDELQGVYPKDFKFTGWHPLCRCFVVPKLADIKEFEEYQQKLLAGEDVSGFEFTGTVKDVPDNFKKWVVDNEERIAKANERDKLPYFIKDNKILVGQYVELPPYSADLGQIDRLLKINRDSKFRFAPNGIYSKDRKALHNEIVDEYFSGGSTQTGVTYMLGGAPANGKSTLVNSGSLPHPKGILKIDPDELKSKFPEYNAMITSGDKRLVNKAAEFIHEESSYLSKVIQSKCKEYNYDYVLDGVNDGSFAKVSKKIQEIKKGGTAVRADYVTLDSKLSMKLALERAERTGRNVPIDFIENMNREVSILIPELIKNKTVDQLYLWDTNINGKPRLILKQINGKLEILDSKLYEDFLSKAR